ncbi:MAG TPA: helix-turn-helix domain-containing protein [Anaeromyxobacteraceae bacterium]|nr:helix-turn-helix domain-containing protein [Anaeromyxobacteraceae bacterium]
MAYLDGDASGTDAGSDQADLLTSGDVARLLGVASATLKRWTDAGRIPCVRTAGGHRRFLRSDVERLRVRLGARGDALARWVDGLLQDRDAALAGALLLERERRGSWNAVAEALGPVLSEVGRRWADGEWCVLEEHAASERLSRALARTAESLAVRLEAPRLLLATAEGDEHTLGLSLVELCARERGWRALWAGRATSAEEVARAVERGEVEAVALSASRASRPESLERELRVIAPACGARGVPFVLGGSGPWPSPPSPGKLERTFPGLEAWMKSIEARRGRAANREGVAG